MGAIASLDVHINSLTGGGPAAPQALQIAKVNRVAGIAPVATVAGFLTSLWQFADCLGQVGSVPGAVAAPDKSTAGAMRFSNPGGGRQLWGVGSGWLCAQQGTLIIYDRLLHIGGLSGTSTSAQTVGGTISRNTGGAGNIVWAEIYTALGATATTITVSYTDQDGNAGQTSSAVAIGGTNLNNAQRLIALPLLSGDTGVQAVASATLAASTLTAGNFGITVGRILGTVPIGPGGGQLIDYITGAPGPIDIPTDACLAMAFMPAGTTAPQLVYGDLTAFEA